MHAQLKQSIIMTGIGLILLFGANSSSLIIMTTYPPWGILSITFMIVGAYFVVIGLDSAGLYIATDSSLRKAIQKSPSLALTNTIITYVYDRIIDTIILTLLIIF